LPAICGGIVLKSAAKYLVTVIVLVIVVWGAYRMRGRAATTEGVVVEQPESVKAAVVAEGPILEEAMMTGEVQAIATVDLAPKVSGRLMQLAVDEGSVVKAGQMVATLDKDAFQAGVDQAQAAVAAAKAAVQSAETARDNSEHEYRRVEALFKQGTSPQAVLDSAESAFKVASSNVDVAKAAALEAEARLEMAEIQLRESVLYAPFDAVVSVKLLDAGALVGAGKPIVTLVSIDTVKVIAGASEQYLADLQAGRTKAIITVDALAGQSFEGTLFRVGATIDQATRTAEVDIRIANGAHALKPGMYARVTLVLKEKPKTVLIPSDALLGREGAYFVYRIEDGRAKRAPVEVGLRGGSVIEAASGVAPGQAVVSSGEGTLYDGARVAVEGQGKAPAPAAAEKASSTVSGEGLSGRTNPAGSGESGE
jgi:RND family efflux transporter MFP subunit